MGGDIGARGLRVRGLRWECGRGVGTWQGRARGGVSDKGGKNVKGRTMELSLEDNIVSGGGNTHWGGTGEQATGQAGLGPRGEGERGRRTRGPLSNRGLGAGVGRVAPSRGHGVGADRAASIVWALEERVGWVIRQGSPEGTADVWAQWGMESGGAWDCISPVMGISRIEHRAETCR